MPDGATDPADSRYNASEESPVLVTGLSFTAGKILQFSATGLMSRGPGNVLVGPDGNLITLPASGHTGGAANGISDYFMPQSALLGVFLSDELPTASAAQARLEFADPGIGNLLDFSSLSPELKQVFFIGDGLDLSSNPQDFVVPVGAKRLLLGTSDIFGWFNNAGGFEVTVTNASSAAPIPLPAAAWLMLAGLGSLVALRRR